MADINENEMFLPIGKQNVGSDDIIKRALSERMRRVSRGKIGSKEQARRRTLVEKFMAENAPGTTAVEVKRYENRKLYMAQASTFITSAEVFELITRGYDVKVVSRADSTYDLTRDALLSAMLLDPDTFPTKSLVNFIKSQRIKKG